MVNILIFWGGVLKTSFIAIKDDQFTVIQPQIT